MDKVKDFVIISIAYITFCGIMYHLVYWGMFNLNGLAYITVGNIVTSALYPIVQANFTILGAIIVLSIQNANEFSAKTNGTRTAAKVKRKYFSVVAFIITLFLYVAFLFIIDRKQSLLNIIPVVLAPIIYNVFNFSSFFTFFIINTFRHL